MQTPRKRIPHTGRRGRAFVPSCVSAQSASSPGAFIHSEGILSKKNSLTSRAHGDWFGLPPALAEQANIRSMDALLGEVLDSLPLAEENLAPEILKEGWRRAAGTFIASQAELVSLSGGTAVVCTMQPTVRYEIDRIKHILLAALRREFGDAGIIRLSVRLG